MPEPSLRQLLLNMAEHDKQMSQSGYVFFKALVEAVEPEAPKFEDTIESWAIRYDEVVRLLAEAKAEIERLQRDKGVFYKTRAFISEELAEAKAEIERLNSKFVAMAIKVDVRKTAADNWLQRCKEAEHRLGVLAVQNQARDADAEIGRLVRGMRSGTRLERYGKYYNGIVISPIHTTHAAGPTAALRAIQEVGDAEMP